MFPSLSLWNTNSHLEVSSPQEGINRDHLHQYDFITGQTPKIELQLSLLVQAYNLSYSEAEAELSQVQGQLEQFSEMISQN